MSWLVPTLHPARLLREPSWLPAVVSDIEKALRITRDGGPSLVPACYREGGLGHMPEWAIYPSIEDARQWFERMRGKCLSVDIESTYYEEIMCIAFWPVEGALDPEGQGICIPKLSQGKTPFWTPIEELEINKLLTKVMESPEWRKCGQNFPGFDAPLLSRRMGMKLSLENFEEWGFECDAMVAHHTVMPAMKRHGLATIASIFTDLPPYKLAVHHTNTAAAANAAGKDDFQKWENVANYDNRKLRSYCLEDTFAVALAVPHLRACMQPAMKMP